MRRFALPLTIVLLAGCATMDTDPTAGLQDAEVVTRTAPNGDVISEYRVGGLLQVVKVVPRNGVTYYLVDDNSDGVLDRRQGEGPITPVQYRLLEW